MILFEVFFEDGSTRTKIAENPMQAAILVMADRINQHLFFGIDSIRNEETGQVYKFEAKITKVVAFIHRLGANND